MTELLFRDDAYLKTATARVVAVDDGAVTTRPHDLLSARRRPAGRHRFIDPRQRRAHRGHRHAQGRPSPARSRTTCAPGAAPPQAGEAVGLEIDWDRRYALMRLHTALHVMSCVVVAPVTGGNIAPDKARLDFDIDITLLDADRIETARTS